MHVRVDAERSVRIFRVLAPNTPRQPRQCRGRTSDVGRVRLKRLPAEKNSLVLAEPVVGMLYPIP
jgi:hypothetical protein